MLPLNGATTNKSAGHSKYIAFRDGSQMFVTPTWASEGGQGFHSPWILKISAKKVLFLISSGKKQISPLLATPSQNFGKKHVPPGKNPSDAHERQPCFSESTAALPLRTISSFIVLSVFVHHDFPLLASTFLLRFLPSPVFYVAHNQHAAR